MRGREGALMEIHVHWYGKHLVISYPDYLCNTMISIMVLQTLKAFIAISFITHFSNCFFLNILYIVFSYSLFFMTVMLFV